MTGVEVWMLGYLVNALWQVPLVLGVAWVLARWARRTGPALQHRIWVGALMAEAVLPACPMRLGDALRSVWAGVLAWPARASEGQVRVGFGAGVVGGGEWGRLPKAVLAGIVFVYAGSVVYFAGRLAWGLWRTRAMRLRAESTPPCCDSAAARMGHPGFTRMGHLGFARMGSSGYGRDSGPAFEVRVSPEVAGPVTVGLWRGVVLLPRGYLERVAEEDFCAVMAHEGAHVRRRDFLKNALYSFATVAVAFHPAMWMTRRRMAESREMICDAMAAEAVAGRERYAGSLLRLASVQVAGTPERMLHAIGIFGFAGMTDANSFERRVMNLTTNRVEMTGVRRAAVALVCGVLGLGTCATALALRIGVPEPQSGSEQIARTDAPARVSGGVMAGQVLSRVNPTYPADAKQEGISGAVVLSAVIGKDGTVENLQVVSGPEKLRTSALDAVRQWTYKPYLLNGQPVEVQTTITVTYSFGGG